MHVQSSGSLMSADLYSWHEQAMIISKEGGSFDFTMSPIVAAVERLDTEFSDIPRDGALPFSMYQDFHEASLLHATVTSVQVRCFA